MFRATSGILLPTTITGSLPRPSWYTENLGPRAFIDAMVSRRFREQYEDALTSYIGAEELAGLDILTDGDCRFDDDVAGQSWLGYPPRHMAGFDRDPRPFAVDPRGFAFPRGHILHDFLESRVYPSIVGPVGRGTLQYAAIWTAAQRIATRPVKFGTVTAELIATGVRDRYYNSVRDRIMAVAHALNEELTELADAGCPAIQIEETQIHSLAARGGFTAELTPDFMIAVFNATVKGLGPKTEVWCHTCWGNPSQQRMHARPPSYEKSLEHLAKIDADVITFECCSSGGLDFKAVAEALPGKKIAIGVIDHHTMQVERPEEVADLIRRALAHIPPERLVVTTDCGLGREGMSRRHAFYKVVSLVLGTNLVRRELGAPEAECRAADGRYTLTESG
jgi:5-methyltetrahydropteroyltriglutamate--homocysteine methyltransferase